LCHPTLAQKKLQALEETRLLDSKTHAHNGGTNRTKFRIGTQEFHASAGQIGSARVTAGAGSAALSGCQFFRSNRCFLGDRNEVVTDICGGRSAGYEGAPPAGMDHFF
jgi:hypothetical protein